MAPEIINKSPNLTWAVDIWSLGCIIIEMATKNPPWSNVSTDCKEVIHLIATSKGNINIFMIFYLAPPKFPSHVSKDLKSFLNLCLQNNPTKRADARKLLEHKFFKVEIPKEVTMSDPSKNKRNSRSSETKTEENITIIQNAHETLTKKVQSSQDSNKMLKNVNFHILEKQEDKKDDENKDNIINILAGNNNDNGAGAFFSISMTVYSGHSLLPQQSLLPHINEFNNNNKIGKILEVDEPEFSPVKKISKDPFFKFDNGNNNNIINIIDNSMSDEINQSTDSIKKLIDVYNLNEFDFTKVDNLDRLGTLEIQKDDLQKLEAFFKERNNKMSIGPIEQDQIHNFMKYIK
jgi:serine/threonine protein kinase